ncbi:hypothetical protein [Aestuariibaculum marinum]|uniref:Nucleotide-diphospho-sugar transferase domain-containing protein n=1 Tax=Aestuariibaculum marinum TaxID=2683592 RepID=A0A8J6U408_9FLAO|nr:hypothetical protein [Aestuariibaculum marinum]MBD0823870.1 hypothetical protein [Aestuariibaculum marinum]
MKKSFCSFVYGNYYRFIPYYLYCVSKYYPTVSVIILYSEELSKDFKKLINSYKNVFLYENVGKDFSWLDEINHRGAAKQTLRHVLTLEVFKNFDVIYFGDVDIMILEEGYDLFDFHLKQAKQSSLPFSNKVRPLPNDGLKSPSERLTGLHFVEVKPYYEKMEPVINEFLNDAVYRNKILKISERNENVLYHLCKSAFDFDPNKIMNNRRPWHGFHLGLVRGKTYLNLQTVSENTDLTVDDLKKQLAELNKKGDVSSMLLKFTCKEVYDTFNYLGIPLSMSVRLKYKVLNFKNYTRNKVGQIKSYLSDA